MYRKIFELTAWLLAVLSVGLMLAWVYPSTYKYATLYARNIVQQDGQKKTYIKWAEFNVPYSALEKTLAADIASQNEDTKICWIEALSLLATKYGGNWKRYKGADADAIIQGLKNGDSFEKLKSGKYYSYFLEVNEAVLGEFLGNYEITTFSDDNPDDKKTTQKYGLTAFSPIAEGYSFSHYDDFGNSRSYGYKRQHLGHDIMGSVGTPIIAVEGGTVEELGWNQYGGWRIGIRSFDKKRYYYYAHLRKDSPYHGDTVRGKTVKAGDVIGYLGMSGYSAKENVNNINVPHLHFGLQLIFDESQKEGTNQIWVDVYALFRLLQKNRSTVRYDRDLKEYFKKYPSNKL